MKICFFSAARSDFDLFASIIDKLKKLKSLKPSVFIASANLSPFHGYAIKQILNDKIQIHDKIENLLASDSWQGRSLSFGLLILGLSYKLANKKPDLFCVCGDREEHLAAAIVANFYKIPVAHFYGGDRCLASDIDEVFRPAISKLSHFHFTSTKEHKKRLIKMGENPNDVWVTGAASLDRLKKISLKVPEVRRKFQIDLHAPFFLVIQHPAPYLPSAGHEFKDMSCILEALQTFNFPIICGYPNHDPGNVAIRKAIDSFKRKNSKIKTYENLDRDIFLTLFAKCTAIIGNSSALIFESGFLKKPAILIGDRQNLRKVGSNVIRAKIGQQQIIKAVKKVLYNKKFKSRCKKIKSIYGNGDAVKIICKILQKLKIKQTKILKTNYY